MSENHELCKEKKTHILGQRQCVMYQRSLKQRLVRNPVYNSIIVSRGKRETKIHNQIRFCFLREDIWDALGSKVQKIPIQTCF